jgi:hypothetical protein
VYLLLTQAAVVRALLLLGLVLEQVAQVVAVLGALRVTTVRLAQQTQAVVVAAGQTPITVLLVVQALSSFVTQALLQELQVAQLQSLAVTSFTRF